MAASLDIDVLVVDDHQFDAEMIKMALRQLGANSVRVASTGDMALDLIRQSAFDLIISDWAMPGMDGLDLLPAVREAQPNAGFLLVTAHTTTGHARQAEAAGVDGFLSKPFKRHQLKNEIEHALGAN